jgi:hypothetical protein
MQEGAIGSLVVESGPGKGRSIDLEPGRTVTIGRLKGSDVLVPESTVSRNQAELIVDQDGVQFVHKGTNPSLIDGVAVRDGQPRPLWTGTKIQIGTCTLVVQLNVEEKTKEYVTPPITTQETGGEISGSSGPKEDGKPREKAKPQAGLLKSPLAKGAVVLLILLLALYAFMPKGGGNDGSKGAGAPDAEKDSLALAVRIPDAVMEGEAPDADRMAAGLLFKAAGKLFSERKLRDQNVFDSIQKWQAGIDLLAKYSMRTSAFDSAAANLRSAKDALHRRFRELEKSARIANKQGDYMKADEEVRTIMSMIPDRFDWRYQWAKDAESILTEKMLKN